MAFIKQHTPKPADEARQQPRDYSHLLSQLDDADASVRRWAARDLADFAESSSALVARLNNERDNSVREVILTTLTTLADATAIAGLAECLRSEDPALRNESIEVMKQLPDKVAPIMRGLLLDADPDVRIFAVNILESLRHPEVEKWLIDVIVNDDNVNVCATAVDLLAEVGSIDAEQALLNLKARFNNEPYIQFVVDLALKRIVEG